VRVHHRNVHTATAKIHIRRTKDTRIRENGREMAGNKNAGKKERENKNNTN
jgi:hypothetical protein